MPLLLDAPCRDLGGVTIPLLFLLAAMSRLLRRRDTVVDRARRAHLVAVFFMAPRCRCCRRPQALAVVTTHVVICEASRCRCHRGRAWVVIFEASRCRSPPANSWPDIGFAVWSWSSRRHDAVRHLVRADKVDPRPMGRDLRGVTIPLPLRVHCDGAEACRRRSSRRPDAIATRFHAGPSAHVALRSRSSRRHDAVATRHLAAACPVVSRRDLRGATMP
jgi:hypothetical protein